MTRWINTRGWLKGYTQDKLKTASSIKPEESSLPKSTVAHVPLKCPRCRSRRVRCYGTVDRPVLYYKCTACGFKFKVLEVEG